LKVRSVTGVVVSFSSHPAAARARPSKAHFTALLYFIASSLLPVRSQLSSVGSAADRAPHADLRVATGGELGGGQLDHDGQHVEACHVVELPTAQLTAGDRKSTRLNSSHVANSYAGLCLKKKKN